LQRFIFCGLGWYRYRTEFSRTAVGTKWEMSHRMKLLFITKQRNFPRTERHIKVHANDDEKLFVQNKEVNFRKICGKKTLKLG